MNACFFYNRHQISAGSSQPESILRPLIFLLVFVPFGSTWSLAAAGESDAFVPPEIAVPEGFEVEIVAAPPLVKHPMMAGFDDQGRLFVAESAGENLRREELEEQLPNFIRMLEDTNGDGRFDKSTIFADQMTFPQGALWHQGALYVASPPAIWRLEDTTGDGVADQREVLVDQFGYTGNAADVHGCFLGPDGRIYWVQGRHGHEVRDDAGNMISQGQGARIFSVRPDGSDFQVHCGGGMDNPVEIDFWPTGEMLGTVNLFYRTRGDCLVHWMRGGVYPRYDQPDVLAEFPRTGDLLGPVHDFGHVAVSGTARLRGRQWGEAYEDNFFVTEFNTNKVVRVRLERAGASFSAQVEDFLTSGSDDFRPTDVFQDTDGSLLVIDTGGWFRIGCPTSQIAKPNIRGAIYRIRRTDAAALDDPGGQQIAWNERNPQQLVELLADPRHVVRERSRQQLALRGEPAVGALGHLLDSQVPIDVQLEAIWTLCRIETDSALAVLRDCLTAAEGDLRNAAATVLGVRQDNEAISLLIHLLDDRRLDVRRSAATALGQIGDPEACAALLAATADASSDRVLQHALIYALIEIGEPEPLWAGLEDSNPGVQTAALWALDQMADSPLQPQHVVRLLAQSEPAVQTAALQIIQGRPEWAEPAATALDGLLAGELGQSQRRQVEALVEAFGDSVVFQERIEQRLADANRPAGRALLEAIAQAGFAELPNAWHSAILGYLASGDPELVAAAVAAAASQVDPFREPLQQIAAEDEQAIDVRVAALAAIAPQQPLTDDAFDLLLLQLEPDVPVTRQLDAARALARTELTAQQKQLVLDRIGQAGPLIDTSLAAVLRQLDQVEQANELLQRLDEQDQLAHVPIEELEALWQRLPQLADGPAGKLLAERHATTAEQSAQLDELEQQWAGGDPQRGRAVFFSSTAACGACHRVEGQGGQIGPELTALGERRTRRDLMEAILYPSASLARGYETYMVQTDDGRIFTGLIVHQSPTQLRLRTADQQEVTLPRDRVDQMTLSPVSIMPEGIDRLLGPEQMRDLLAFLESL